MSIDSLRPLKLPLVLFAIIASLWAYARAQSLSQQASQAYWPALPPAEVRVAAAGGDVQTVPAQAEDFDVELVEVENDGKAEHKAVAAEAATPAPVPVVTPTDSSQTR